MQEAATRPGWQAQIDISIEKAQETAAADLLRAEELATESYNFAVVKGYLKGQADALYVMALVRYFRAEYTACFEKLDRCLTIYESLGDENGRVQKMTLLGSAYRQLGDLVSALEVHQEQLGILNRFDNKRLRARVLNSIGGIYQLLKQPQEVVRYLEQALNIVRELEQPQDAAVILGNLSEAWSMLGEHGLALMLGRQGLASIRETDNHPLYENSILAALANASSRAGNYEEAEQYFLEALQASIETGNQQQQRATLAELCHMELQRNNPQKALDYGLRAIENLPKDAEKTLYEAFAWIAQAYRRVGDFERAWEYLERFHVLNRELFTERSDERLRLLEVRYKTAQARQEAEFYQQRNRELEDEAERAREYFDKLNELKDDLLNATSHNLKNPLSTIRTSAYLLGRLPEVQFSKGMEYVDSIVRQTDMMAQLLADVLELAKLETRRAIQRRETPLNSLLRDCITNFNMPAQLKNISLILELPDDSIKFGCDPRLITQALHSLISNAIKYTPNDGTVTLRAAISPADVSISVQDTGIGIPAEAIAHVFERFYRIEEHNNYAEGTGLGLSIAQSIIEQHNGSINVKSEPGKGSIFSICLPR